MTDDERSWRHPSAQAAHRLSRALERHGITGEVHEGRGLALVSVWVDLVAWTDGSCFWWSGAVTAGNRRSYSYSPADDPVTTARRVAERYAQLRRQSEADRGREPAHQEAAPREVWPQGDRPHEDRPAEGRA
ncbi:hypothetical protein DQ384_20915 [Sphaerisporangium album]|uniref:Uncharacterized protein n=1 Tax=Sphaerisporangium album TaxID=509200 RepID=A0A367FIH3_9ACTN|nr:hypothetical protein [Sphaerisporangium album]RCG29497.1 hypothetical protein DQ384_20915 [Sphaerisporangium album]